MAGLDVKASVTPQWREASGRWARADVGNTLARSVQGWGSAAVRELREATPVRSGQARAAWRADWMPTQRSVKVSNQTPYLPFLLTGTRPHDIRPRTASRLRFIVGDRAVFARAVHHPGTQPDPQLGAALERLNGSAVADLHQSCVEVIQQLAG